MISLKKTQDQLIRESRQKIRSTSNRLDREMLVMKQRKQSIERRIMEAKAKRDMVMLRTLCYDLVKINKDIEMNERQMNVLKQDLERFKEHNIRKTRIDLLKARAAVSHRVVASVGSPVQLMNMQRTMQRNEDMLKDGIDSVLDEGMEDMEDTDEVEYADDVDALINKYTMEMIPDAPLETPKSSPPSPTTLLEQRWDALNNDEGPV